MDYKLTLKGGSAGVALILLSTFRQVCYRQDGGNVNGQVQRKCAYSECLCVVSEGKYCSDYCADADDTGETEIQCDCKHAPCALN
jgi:hypothetical protein